MAPAQPASERVAGADRRARCYAAAMARAFNAPATLFMPSGPRKWALEGRACVIRAREENDGIPTLVEMCVRALDSEYDSRG